MFHTVIQRSFKRQQKCYICFVDNSLLFPTVKEVSPANYKMRQRNVNFLFDDIVHALQNTIDSCINAAMHRSTRLIDYLLYTRESRGHPLAKAKLMNRPLIYCLHLQKFVFSPLSRLFSFLQFLPSSPLFTSHPFP